MIPASIWDGELRVETHDEAAAVWCRCVARGRIAERLHDGTRGDYRVHLALVVDHPELAPGEVYALFWMSAGQPRVYRTTRADAVAALHSHGGFNLT